MRPRRQGNWTTARSKIIDKPPSQKLSIAFDPDRLLEDLKRLSPEDWHTHEQTGLSYVRGRYLTAPLVAAGGSASDVATYHSSDFRPTPILEKCPYFFQLVSHFRSSLSRVRLMQLTPGASLEEHVDLVDQGVDFQLARFHVPIVTNPGSEMIVDGQRAEMKPGECWYLDVGLPHSAANRGDEARIHLVVDCYIDDFANELVGYDILAHRKAHVDIYQGHAERMKAEYQRELRRYRLRRLPVRILNRLRGIFRG